MSLRSRNTAANRRRPHALIFAALGDATRLSLISKLCEKQPRSISELTAGFELTRQAITKHLRVLETAGIVHVIHTGRESRFELNARPIREARGYLDSVSEQWDRALSRLKTYVEQ